MNRAEPFKSTEVGEIPESWEVAQLGDVFDVQQGKALSPSARRGLSPRPFLRTANVMWGRLDLMTLDQMDFTDDEANRLSLKPGDLLVCEGGEIGRTAIWKGALEGCLYQNHIHRLRAKKSDISSDFVMYWMQAAFLHLRLYGGVGNRTTIPNLSGARLKSLHIPLPPVPEQRAIAAVLTKIQASVEVQDKIIATLKELKAATMAKLFREGLRGEPPKQTEIGEIPKSWDVVRLGEIAERITKGSSPNWQGFDYCDEGALFVRSQNVGLGELLLSETVYVPQEFNRKERRSVLSPGDVLINIVGASIGRAAVADARLNGANINQAVALVRLSPGRCNPIFLAHFLISRAGLEQMHRQKKEIARANLSLEDVGSFLVPVPARDEQDEIAESLERIARRVRATERQRDLLNSVFSSLLHLLMTGEIRLSGFGRRPNLDSPWFKPEDVWEFVGCLVRKFDPERVILFGSRAWGTPSRDSDVDLLVVMEFAGRPVDMAVRIGAECDDRFAMDLIVRRPGEVRRRIAMGDPFFKQILRDGLVLHERAA